MIQTIIKLTGSLTAAVMSYDKISVVPWCGSQSKIVYGAEIFSLWHVYLGIVLHSPPPLWLPWPWKLLKSIGKMFKKSLFCRMSFHLGLSVFLLREMWATHFFLQKFHRVMSTTSRHASLVCVTNEDVTVEHWKKIESAWWAHEFFLVI